MTAGTVCTAGESQKSRRIVDGKVVEVIVADILSRKTIDRNGVKVDELIIVCDPPVNYKSKSYDRRVVWCVHPIESLMFNGSANRLVYCEFNQEADPDQHDSKLCGESIARSKVAKLFDEIWQKEQS